MRLNKIIMELTEEKTEETTVSKETESQKSQTPETKEKKNSTATTVMESLSKKIPAWPEEGDLLEGEVIARGKLTLYVDIPPYGTGIIFGREYLNARDVIKKISIGDSITTKVVTLDGESGYIELSLKEAKKAILWSEAEQAIKNKTQFSLPIKEANKGGLILEWQGVEGFLPASQLSPENYPRIPDGDKDKIMEELKKMVGQNITVTIINADPKENKLIFSEKNIDNRSRKEIVNKYELGDVVESEVTGVVDFGIFVKVEEGLEGLVHISELDWALVENPRELFRIGDKIKVKIIEIKENKISLSVKALKPNPWEDAKEKYKPKDVTDGVVIKYNKHGALVSIEEGVSGLVHISEFKDEKDLREKLELGKTYKFIINIFEPKDQRLTLSLATEDQATADPSQITA